MARGYADATALALALALTLVLVASAARADELADSPVRAGYEPSARAFDFAARREWDSVYGIDPMLTYSAEVFAAPQLAQDVTSGGLLMLELDVALDKLIGSGWGAAYVAGFAIHGDSLTDELGDVFGASSITAPNDVRLFEAWLEQPIGAVTVRGGLLAADQEFVLADESSTLLAATFGITAQFSSNIIGPVYPVATPGISARLELEPFIARVALYDGTLDNEHGIPSGIGPDSLVIGEVGIGPVRVGAWHHSALGDAIYATGDLELEKYVGAFARAGYAPDGPLRTYIDAGVRFVPHGWRAEDVISIGLAFATTPEGAQTLAEATYECQLAWFTIQPDFQLVFMHDRTVGIMATRATVVF